MKATITLTFEKINGFTVNDELLEKIPQLKNETIKTVKLVCENLQKYFKDHKIKIKYHYHLE